MKKLLLLWLFSCYGNTIAAEPTERSWVEDARHLGMLAMVIALVHLLPVLCIVPNILEKHDRRLASNDHRVIQVLLRLRRDYSRKSQTLQDTRSSRAQEVTGRQNAHQEVDVKLMLRQYAQVQWVLQWFWILFSAVSYASGSSLVSNMHYMPCYIIMLIHILVLVETAVSREQRLLVHSYEYETGKSIIQQMRESQPDLAFMMQCCQTDFVKRKIVSHQELRPWNPYTWQDMSEELSAISATQDPFVSVRVQTAFIPGNLDTTKSLLNGFRSESERMKEEHRDKQVDSSLLFACKNLLRNERFLIYNGRVPLRYKVWMNSGVMWVCTLLGLMLPYRYAFNRVINRRRVEYALAKWFYRKATLPDFGDKESAAYDSEASVFAKERISMRLWRRNSINDLIADIEKGHVASVC